MGLISNITYPWHRAPVFPFSLTQLFSPVRQLRLDSSVQGAVLPANLSRNQIGRGITRKTYRASRPRTSQALFETGLCERVLLRSFCSPTEPWSNPSRHLGIFANFRDLQPVIRGRQRTYLPNLRYAAARLRGNVISLLSARMAAV